MSEMLINAIQREELRVAIVKGDKLDDFDVERIGVEQKKANIYKGKITRLEPSLGAAFVDYGAERHGFLPLKEISKEYFQAEPTKALSQMDIKELLREGQEVMVQIDKEERGNKGAALTTFVSLAGSFLVLMPNNPRSGGISRRIEGRERDELRTAINKLGLAQEMSVIIRTAGVGRSAEELQWDLDMLLHHWQAIKEAFGSRPAPFLIHQESNIVIRALRDCLRSDIERIHVDEQETFNKVREYLQQVRPDFVVNVHYYEDKVPLFSKYRIESQVETAYQRVVILPSGGSIVIDPTEALISIDVNSAKATSGKDIEETAVKTNLEAADEIARQLRLRDIGGLIVIDFIDMLSMSNQREVTNRLRDALAADRARVRIGNITRFGLMEMSRQRIRPPLGEGVLIPCPRCEGCGTIRSISSLAFSIIRLIEENAVIDKTAQIQAHLPLELATYIINEKRHLISAIEQKNQVNVLIIPTPHLQTPKYRIRRLRIVDMPKGSRHVASYKLIEVPKVDAPLTPASQIIAPTEQPAVKAMLPSQPVPKRETPAKPGMIKKFLQALFGKKPAPVEQPKPTPRSTRPYYSRNKPRRNYYHKPSSTRRGTRGGQQRRSPSQPQSTTTSKQS